MCGFVGVLSSGAENREIPLVSRMANEIAHRGPDDSGVYTSGPVAFGFRRLSVLDLTCGHQPMVSQDQRFALVFNGEIYNYREIRNELQQEHQRNFSTQSDTEVVLQSFEVWGADSFAKFNGMFAIAIWDNQSQRLIIARDRSGKKPLFTYATPSCLLFASEIKAFRVHPQFSARPDFERVATSIAYRYVPGHETLFDNVFALSAGHWAEIELASDITITSKPFWINPACKDREKSSLRPDDATEQLRDLLSASVRRRLVADVPVGAFLSGGVDSSLIVALMAEEAGSRLKTFSIGFDTGFSEHNYARMVADKFGTQHHETIVNAADLLEEIPAVLWHRETPVSEPSDIPLYMLSREARKQVTVVLSGEGSDELFAGYPKYMAEKYLGDYPGRLMRSIAPAFRNLLNKGGGSSSSGVALESISEADQLDSMARWFGGFGSRARASLLADNVTSIHDFAQETLDTYSDCTYLTKMQILDFAHWLPANLLLRGDRVSMAHSLELRCPFLDRDVIDLAFGSIPDKLKIRHGQGKWLVRQVAKNMLPPEVVERRKWGFKVPVSEWFRGPLKPVLHEVLLSDRAARRGYFHKSEIERLVSEQTSHGINHSKQLWYLFQLELWHLMFIDGVLHPSDTLSGRG